MKKILVVFGTRPEAIKLAPLILALKEESGFSTYVCHSGQHRTLCDDVLEFFNISPDINLNIGEMGGGASALTANAISAFTELVTQKNPDAVIVHGDTSTAFACALSAFYMKIPVIHIEAGLRSHNIKAPFPEEWNRVAIDILSEYCFLPSEEAKQNLISEGKSKNLFVVGNTVTDALKYTLDDSYKSELLEDGKRLIIFTAHRRENLGSHIENMCLAVKKLAREYKDIKIICPVHPNPAVRSVVEPLLSCTENITVLPPLCVYDFHNLLSRAYLILSDSGGIQEEASTLAIPTLVMRNETERSEARECGIVRLVGRQTDRIYQEARLLLDDKNEHLKMKKFFYPYGDGKVSQRILKILRKVLMN